MTSAIRTILVGVFCATVSGPGVAQAQTLTVPSGTVQSPTPVVRGSTMTITWTTGNFALSGGPQNQLVDLGYWSQGGFQPSDIALGEANDGSYAWKVPYSLTCDATYTVQLNMRPVGSPKSAAATYAQKRFRVTCPPIPVAESGGEVGLADGLADAAITPTSLGSLIVTKTVVNNTGRPTGALGFDIDVTCGRTLMRRVNLADGGQETVTGIANGELCTIKESPPPAPAGCAWTASYPKGTTVRVGMSARPGGPGGQQSSTAAPRLEVVNTLTCKGGNGGAFGSLMIEKQIVVLGSIQPPVMPFTVDVACSPGGPSLPLTLDSSNGYRATVPGIAPGSSCSFSERTPVVPLNYVQRGCSWSVAYPNGKTVGMPAMAQSALRRIVNTWRCGADGGGPTGGGGDEGNGDGGKTGSLTVIKEVVNDSPGFPPPSTTFSVVVACQPGGSQTVALNAGNNYRQTVTGLPLGATCTVSEQPPVVPSDLSRRCRWATSYPDRQTVRITGRLTVGVRIVNRWSCAKDGGGDGDGRKTGSLTIVKELINSAPGTPPVNTSFSVVVTCQPGGTQTVVLNAGNGFHVTLTGLPQGALCTVTEQPPVVPSELARRCRWVTTYPAGQKAEVTDRRDLTIKVTNQWICGTAS